jgi:hypothetical protein
LVFLLLLKQQENGIQRVGSATAAKGPLVFTFGAEQSRAEQQQENENGNKRKLKTSQLKVAVERLETKQQKGLESKAVM